MQLKASALNHVDIDIRDGVSRFNFVMPHILGIEGAGVVAASEVASTGRWRSAIASPSPTSARAMPASGASVARTTSARTGACSVSTSPARYAQYMVAPASHCIALPDHVSFADAAASLVAFGTAWHGLVTRGSLTVGRHRPHPLRRERGRLGCAADLQGGRRHRHRDGEHRREARAGYRRRGRSRHQLHGRRM